MDGFSLVGGLGSLVVAGLCYSAYRSVRDIASHLKQTEHVDVGKELFEKIKTAPNHTLEYIAIRGDAKAIESTLPSSNVPSAKLLIHMTTIYEHKAQWIQNSKLWHDVKRTISTVINDVPFSLNSARSSHRVVVDEPLSASGLEYTRIYDKYEPLNSMSVPANLLQWVSGDMTKGIQTIEDGLMEGSTLTAVGKVTLRGGTIKIKQPDTYEFILSKQPFDSIIREKTRSARQWKYVTIGFAVAGGVFLMIWAYKKWRQARSERVPLDRFTRIHFNERLEQNLASADEEQSCVICLTRRRNVVILDCGHICVCRACAMQLDTCPICRAEIVRLVPTYQS